MIDDTVHSQSHDRWYKVHGAWLS